MTHLESIASSAVRFCWKVILFVYIYCSANDSCAIIEAIALMEIIVKGCFLLYLGTGGHQGEGICYHLFHFIRRGCYVIYYFSNTNLYFWWILNIVFFWYKWYDDQFLFNPNLRWMHLHADWLQSIGQQCQFCQSSSHGSRQINCGGVLVVHLR